MSKHVYGWKKDCVDKRDFKFSIPRHIKDVSTLPAVVDLSATPAMPPVYDQGQVGSCVGNSTAGADHFRQMQDNPATAFQPSRLFLYWDARALEGTTGEDSGAQIRDAIKQMAALGVCPEVAGLNSWPYDTTKVTTQPTAGCFAEALRHKILSYESLTQDIDHLRACLAAGHPFVFGMQVFAQMESAQCAQDGRVQYPSCIARMRGSVGGHAVLCVGYDDNKRLFKVRNSWGTGWGDKGYFYIPYRYMLDTQLVSDLWVVYTVQE